MATLHTETSLCLLFVWCSEVGRILAQPVDLHCALFMVSLNGALMKTGDHFRPHCSCQIFLLGTTFIIFFLFLRLATRIDFGTNFYANLGNASMLSGYKATCSCQIIFHSVLFFDFVKPWNSKPVHLSLPLLFLKDALK